MYIYINIFFFLTFLLSFSYIHICFCYTPIISVFLFTFFPFPQHMVYRCRIFQTLVSFGRAHPAHCDLPRRMWNIAQPAMFKLKNWTYFQVSWKLGWTMTGFEFLSNKGFKHGSNMFSDDLCLFAYARRSEFPALCKEHWEHLSGWIGMGSGRFSWSLLSGSFVFLVRLLLWFKKMKTGFTSIF